MATRIPTEIACALSASMLVSPIVSVLDKAMVKEISGVAPFVKEIASSASEIITKPTKFFGSLSFRLTFAVYAGTYAVANLSEALLDVGNVQEESQRKPVKVGFSSAANVGLLLWRDSIFAKTYSGAPPKPTPWRTLAGFAVRDTATCTATFYLAPKAADYLIKEHEVNEEVAKISTALLVPGVTQIITAPIHILALDIYARTDSTIGERMLRIQQEFRKIAFARTLRILPAFGLGSYSNTKFRHWFIKEEETPIVVGNPFELSARLTQRRDMSSVQ